MQGNLYISNFKKFLIFIFKIILFILVLIPVVLFIGKKYSYASNENIINAYNKTRFDEFYELEKDSLDLVFVGSSHSYCTFNPKIFEDYFDIDSFQMGMPLQHPDSTYYTLKEIFNYQKPKVVVLEVYWNLLKNDFDLNQVKTLFQVLENDDLKKDFIKKDFPLDEKVKYAIDIFKYQGDYFAFKANELNKKLKNKFNLKDKEVEKQKGEEKYGYKGYVYSNYKMLDDEYYKTNQFKGEDGMDFEFSNTQKKYLEKIIDICRENNAKLVFVTAPIANVSMDLIKNYENINKKISEFAKENNIEYIDYNLINKDEKLLVNDNFRDDAHLNDSGASLISKHFAKFLKKYFQS